MSLILKSYNNCRLSGYVKTRSLILKEGLWLDATGSPMTDAAQLTERFRRPNFGHMEIEITVNDPKAYTRPWTVTLHHTLQLDADLLEFICNEGEQDASHLSAK